MTNKHAGARPRRRPSLDAFAEALVAAFPGLAGSVRPLTVLGEGYMSLAIETKGGVVFRFPKGQDAADLSAVEVRLLPVLAPALPVAVPVPEWEGEPSRICPWPFYGYRKVEGSELDLDALGPSAVRRLAEHLGGFLAALHAFPAGQAAELGVPMAGRERYEQQRDAVLPSLGRLMEPAEYSAVEAWWEAFLEDARNWSFAPALVHGDLGPEHLLLDERGALTGVIDFGEVRIGDPAADFAALGASIGADFAHAVLTAYRRRSSLADDDLSRRAALMAQLLRFTTINAALRLPESPQVPTLETAVAKLRADAILDRSRSSG